MSKERKIINQRIEINNDITISDLVTAIPAGFSGPIFINGDLIILEEDVLNFGYSDMWLFNEVHIIGNLIELIDEKNMDLSKLKQINLTVQGNFYCEKSVSMKYLSLEVKGDMKTYSNINARNLKIAGDLACLEASTEYDLIVRGNLTSEYKVSATYIDVRGDLICENIFAKNVNVLGDLSFDNTNASFLGVNVENDIYVRGSIYCSKIVASKIIAGNNCTSDTSIETSVIQVGGNLDAYNIEAHDSITVNGKILAPHN